jgi:hypothetical protein
MRIIKATYGPIDVTDRIKHKVNGERFLIKVDNSICGDPEPGVVKHLQVNWEEANGGIYSKSWAEGTLCQIPVNHSNRLGIFYTNNNNPKTYDTIDLALKSIQKAAEGKADILTSVWTPIQGNPFPELVAWSKNSSHLNQLLQIMQLLYTAQEIGGYDYVSFLEHDCLYAEGYFDYPEFKDGTVLANMNYGGLCKEGWQKRHQHDQPHSQLTMRFTDAVKHCEAILPNALVRNSGLIEPQFTKTNWEAPNESIHVNHGFHFTSHFSIYSKTDIQDKHSYWGDCLNYVHLFNK